MAKRLTMKMFDPFITPELRCVAVETNKKCAEEDRVELITIYQYNDKELTKFLHARQEALAVAELRVSRMKKAFRKGKFREYLTALQSTLRGETEEYPDFDDYNEVVNEDAELEIGEDEPSQETPEEEEMPIKPKTRKPPARRPASPMKGGIKKPGIKKPGIKKPGTVKETAAKTPSVEEIADDGNATATLDTSKMVDEIVEKVEAAVASRFDAIDKNLADLREQNDKIANAVLFIANMSGVDWELYETAEDALNGYINENDEEVPSIYTEIADVPDPEELVATVLPEGEEEEEEEEGEEEE